ncbi:superinfection immunity protein [Bradyrhizobium canariense]|uniref:superinfection immunity protein n=1 Tax=Bradyrhizobium canariense TaxID=255045 RepID=UPI000A21B7F0|nr:superinfection immunity protein [Bradyrhizobium canariense]OSI77975.1 hypothetical protein BSZ22_03310 [Bradyrhizobium canariense]OSI82150.1 hypothetical protein BSZ23_02935 [Bradyrhizobium canariense]
MIRFVRFILFFFLTGVPQGAFAQQREIFDLFGGMIRSGIAVATQADWERLPGSEVACLDGALRQRGSSINEMIRQGVSPSDPRVSGFRNQCRNQSNASGPSFDCRRARFADEIAVCGDPELARLDRMIGQGYQDMVAKFGDGPARSVAAPLLAARRACQSDVGCIKNAQLSAIRQLQRQGAVITEAEATPAGPEAAAQTPMAEAIYAVEGLHLGGRVSLRGPSYLEYRCNPSDQFAGLTWCQKRRQETSPRGAYTSTTTIVHANDGTALYINRYLEPAFFAGTEAMDDVRRLSAKYGEPRYVTPPVAVGPRTLMATWGDVSLQPLDRVRLADLAAGRDVRAGILVDHIGNFQRSASIGLPVYRVTGGAGYVWAASWDPAGRGTLRFLTIDPSRLLPGASAAPDMAANTAPPQLTPTTAESSPPAPIASPPAAQPTSQPSPTPTVAVSSPVIADQRAQTQNSKSESSAKPLEPAPVAPAITPVSPTKQPDPAEPTTAAAARPADTGRQTPPTPSANEPVQPRVVGPPIAIQPAAKTPETNYLQWALVAAVLILIGAVGFLLFDRRKKIDPISSPATAPVPVLMDVKLIEPSTMASSEDKALHPEEPERAAPTMQEPPSLPIELPEAAATGGTSDANASAPAPALQGSDVRRSSNITEHRHFGIGLIAAIVALSALMSMSVGLVGMIPLALAVYLLPTIIAFKVRHHYAWVLGILNVFFGFTVLGWLGFFVWALIGPRKSALDAMSQHSALGLAKTPTGDPALTMSDYDLRSGWKMPVLQAEIFSFEGDGVPVESADSIKVFFKNPVIGIWRTGPASSGSNSVRYNVANQVRCLAITAAETKLRVGRTLGRTALTGIGAAILTGRQSALGAAFLDYRFGGDETDELVAALIVFSDYSSIVLQSESNEFEKLCALLPPHVLSDEVQAQTAEEVDRIKRMAADGPRVLEEMKTQIAETERTIVAFAEQAKSGETFAERDEGRIGLSQAEERVINERAVLNAVDRLIRLAASRELPGRRTA